MKKRMIYALFALMMLAASFTGCRSQELCPAYGDATVEKTQENLS